MGLHDAPKVSNHSNATLVILWTKLDFHIAFYTFNFFKGIFYFQTVCTFLYYKLTVIFPKESRQFSNFPRFMHFSSF
jgi:hypothetical protein